MIAEIDSDSIPAIVVVAIVGSRWDHWRSLAKLKFGFHMIVAIAEQFTSHPSDCERLSTIIWKPGFMVAEIVAIAENIWSLRSSQLLSLISI